MGLQQLSSGLSLQQLMPILTLPVAQDHRDVLPWGIELCNCGLPVLDQGEELLRRMDGAQ